MQQLCWEGSITLFSAKVSGIVLQERHFYRKAWPSVSDDSSALAPWKSPKLSWQQSLRTVIHSDEIHSERDPFRNWALKPSASASRTLRPILALYRRFVLQIFHPCTRPGIKVWLMGSGCSSVSLADYGNCGWTLLGFGPWGRTPQDTFQINAPNSERENDRIAPYREVGSSFVRCTGHVFLSKHAWCCRDLRRIC